MRFLFIVNSLCVLMFFGCSYNESKNTKIELKKDVLSISVLENKKIMYNNKEYLFCDIEEVLIKDLSSKNVEDSEIKFSAEKSLEMSYINCLFNSLAKIGVKNIIAGSKNGNSVPISNEDRFNKSNQERNSNYFHVYIKKDNDKVSFILFDGKKKVNFNKLKINFKNEGDYIIKFSVDKGVSYHDYSHVINSINKIIRNQNDYVSQLVFNMNYENLSEFQKEELKTVFSVSLEETSCPVCW